LKCPFQFRERSGASSARLAEALELTREGRRPETDRGETGLRHGGDRGEIGGDRGETGKMRGEKVFGSFATEPSE